MTPNDEDGNLARYVDQTGHDIVSKRVLRSTCVATLAMQDKLTSTGMRRCHDPRFLSSHGVLVCHVLVLRRSYHVPVSDTVEIDQPRDETQDCLSIR
jgi:hypothetical protein